jgi:ATP-binding cassette subfamily B protein
MENICYGNPEASEDQVIQATRAAGIHEFISMLPEGYETKLGEDGVNLSEGQKQRLSISRASLPSLVQGKTLFVVTSRLPAIVDSDRVLLLNENRLVAIGTHQSLLETNDYYRSLVADRA